MNMSSNKFFGFFFSIVFALAALYLRDHFFTAIFFLILMSIIFIITVFNLKILGKLNTKWKKFGIILGKFISPIVLFFIYFFVVFPTKIMLKIFNKDVLSLRINKSVNTYWVEKGLSQNMDKQY